MRKQRKNISLCCNPVDAAYNNEIDRAYYFTILRTPWGEQMEDGLLCNSMGRIVDRTAMLEKLLKKLLKTIYDSYSMVERIAL